MKLKTNEMELWELLVDFRKASGLSQEEVGARLNLSRQAISNWEKGTTKPTIENLIQLSRLYNVPLSRLTGTPQSELTSKKRNPLLIPLIAALVCVIILVSALIGIGEMEEAARSIPNIDELQTDQLEIEETESFDFEGW